MIGNDTMKCLPELDRPYERIEKYGTNTLTDSELLAVIIKTGTRNKKAIDVARLLLNRFDEDLGAVCNAGISELMQTEGIGRVKALQIKAAGEIALRVCDRRLPKGISAKKFSLLGMKLSNDMGSLSQEVFRILMLNARFRIFKEKNISVGILNSTIIHPREVFAEALKERSAYIVLVHNHPSGEETPGFDDFQTTEKLVSAGFILGIPVFDHIVVGYKNYYSMRERGDLEKIENKLIQDNVPEKIDFIQKKG